MWKLLLALFLVISCKDVTDEVTSTKLPITRLSTTATITTEINNTTESTAPTTVTNPTSIILPITTTPDNPLELIQSFEEVRLPLFNMWQMRRDLERGEEITEVLFGLDLDTGRVKQNDETNTVADLSYVMDCGSDCFDWVHTANLNVYAVKGFGNEVDFNLCRQLSETFSNSQLPARRSHGYCVKTNVNNIAIVRITDVNFDEGWIEFDYNLYKPLSKEFADGIPQIHQIVFRLTYAQSFTGDGVELFHIYADGQISRWEIAGTIFQMEKSSPCVTTEQLTKNLATEEVIGSLSSLEMKQLYQLANQARFGWDVELERSSPVGNDMFVYTLLQTCLAQDEYFVHNLAKQDEYNRLIPTSDEGKELLNQLQKIVTEYLSSDQ